MEGLQGLDETIRAARALRDEGRLDEADTLLTRAAGEVPSEPRLLHERAMIALRRQNYADVLELASAALKLDEARPYTWSLLGEAYRRLGRPHESEEAVARSRELQRVDFGAGTNGHRLGASAPIASGTNPLESGQLLYTTRRRALSYSRTLALTFPIAVLLSFAYAIVAPIDTDPDSWESNISPKVVLAIPSAAACVVLLSMVLRGKCHRYTVYEHRIDVSSGILFRRTYSIWLFKVKDAEKARGPINFVTRNATILLHIDGAGLERLEGFGPPSVVDRLWRELRDAAVVDRRGIKQVWI